MLRNIIYVVDDNGFLVEIVEMLTYLAAGPIFSVVARDWQSLQDWEDWWVREDQEIGAKICFAIIS